MSKNSIPTFQEWLEPQLIEEAEDITPENGTKEMENNGNGNTNGDMTDSNDKMYDMHNKPKTVPSFRHFIKIPFLRQMGLGNGKEGRTTSNGVNVHFHTFKVNKKGDGKTTRTVGEGPGHSHRVENWQILAGGVDNHSHTIL